MSSAKPLPIARPTGQVNVPPTWEDLTTPLDLDKIESQVEELYVLPLCRLIKSLCDEIRELRQPADEQEVSMSTISKFHYVECHVIVKGDPGAGSLVAVKALGWWGARLGIDTSGEEQRDDLILTIRKPTSDAAIDAIRGVTAILREKGFDVVRGKAEVVTFDTKYGDEL